jgi:hypothetical protein
MENQNLKRGVSRMERFAFDNFDTFDPEMFDPEMYDPSNATDSSYYDDEDNYDLPNGYAMQPKKASKSRVKSQPLAQIDIVLDNSAMTSTYKTTVELFNYLRSNTLITNSSYSSTAGTFRASAFDTLQLRSTPATGQILSDALLIYWNSAGELVYSRTEGTTNAVGTVVCKISCPQVPYRVLHEATRNNLLWIEKIRMSVTTDAQIDNPINIFKNTFLGGTKSNQIAPRSEFKPNQFQSKIVDVPIKTAIDAETGLSYTLNSQEKVTLSLFFRFLRGNEYMVNEGF